MNNELIPKTSMPPAAQKVEQTGSTNVHVTNQGGGVVNINYNYQQPGGSNSAEQLMAIQSFSKEYYQLLVPPEILERCSSLSDAGVAELKTFPALICRENTEHWGRTDPNQWAIYGYIRRVKKEGKNIKVAFQPISAINQQLLCAKKNAIYFDLNMDCALTDLNFSAWSVHKVNLFEAFDEAGFTTLPRPS